MFALVAVGAVLLVALLREEIGLSHLVHSFAPVADCGNLNSPSLLQQPIGSGEDGVPVPAHPAATVDDFVDRPLHTDTLTASLPPWLFKASVMARFQRANSDLWTPRPDVGPGPLSLSRSQGDEDNYAYNHFFFGRGNGTFLEMGASRFKLSP